MTDTQKPRADVNLPKLLGITLHHLPRLLFRTAALYLRFRGTAQKGGRVFEHELIKQGIDSHTAAALTDQYLEANRLQAYLRMLR